MKVKINGEEQEFADGLSLERAAGISCRFGRAAWSWSAIGRSFRAIAIDATLITDGDTLEIVHFVGGG